MRNTDFNCPCTILLHRGIEDIYAIIFFQDLQDVFTQNSIADAMDKCDFQKMICNSAFQASFKITFLEIQDFLFL